MRHLKKLQAWYQTDIGFEATKEKILRACYRREIIGEMQDDRGRLSFSLKDFKDITFQVTTKGKLGIFYPEESSVEECLELVKPYLVKVDGSPAEVFRKIKEPGDRPAKDLIDLNLLEKFEEKLGPELDFIPLRMRVESLNSLMRADRSISSHEAKLTKLKIDSDVQRIKMQLNQSDPHLLDKCNLLNALRDHLRLAVDSLAKK